MNVKIKKLNNCISIPLRNYNTDAGADVFATEDKILKPGERFAMPLGFCIEIPENYMGIITTKSSTFKKGLFCHIPPVDCGYTGEVHGLIENSNDYELSIKKGDKVGQLVILPIITPQFEEVDELEEKERGSNAFGSTGSSLNEESSE